MHIILKTLKALLQKNFSFLSCFINLLHHGKWAQTFSYLDARSHSVKNVQDALTWHRRPQLLWDYTLSCAQ